MQKAFLLVILLAVPLNAQHIQRWDIPKDAKYVQLRTFDGEAIGFEARFETAGDWWVDIYASLHAYVPEAGTTARHYELWPREYYHQSGTEGTWPGFSWDVTRTRGGDILIAVALLDLFETDVGARIDSVRDLLLLRLADGRAERIARIPGSLRPCFFASANEETWLSWEHVVQKNIIDSIPGPWSTVQDYSAEICAARITSGLTLDSAIILGPGHTPRFVESGSGDLHVLRRRIDFSAEKVNDIILTRVAPSAGPDIVVGSIANLKSYAYHGALPETVEGTRILPGSADDFHMIYQTDSLHYLRIAKDGSVEHRAHSSMSNRHFFQRGSDGVPMLFWNATDDTIAWSDAAAGGMFSTVMRVPGNGNAPWLRGGWTAQSGKDWGVTLLHLVTGDSSSLAMLRDAESSSPRETHLFSLPEDLHGNITDWSLTQEGALWIMHQERAQNGSLLHDLLRVTDLPLEARPLRETPLHPDITGLYPHPVRKHAVLQLDLPVGGILFLTVTDLNGRMVTRVPAMDVRQGDQRISLNLPGLASGTYFLDGVIGPYTFSRMVIVR